MARECIERKRTRVDQELHHVREIKNVKETAGRTGPQKSAGGAKPCKRNDTFMQQASYQKETLNKRVLKALRKDKGQGGFKEQNSKQVTNPPWSQTNRGGGYAKKKCVTMDLK